MSRLTWIILIALWALALWACLAALNYSTGGGDTVGDDEGDDERDDDPREPR